MVSITTKNLNVKFPLAGVPLKRMLLNTFSKANRPVATPTGFHALKNISLELKQGDRLAVLGNNGAGKTTLLRTLAGIYEPFSGEIEVDGFVTSLISVTAGMEMNLSGRENIYVKGAYMGLSAEQMSAIESDVIEFAELGDFIDEPVKRYSSGMIVRLAFAISTSIPVDILLLDEWLSAGDKNFIEKSEKRMSDLVGRSSILVFASHSMAHLQTWCNKAIVMNNGESSVLFDDVDEAIDLYMTS